MDWAGEEWNEESMFAGADAIVCAVSKAEYISEYVGDRGYFLK